MLDLLRSLNHLCAQIHNGQRCVILAIIKLDKQHADGYDDLDQVKCDTKQGPLSQIQAEAAFLYSHFI